jgi:hypothetical protein
MLKIMTQKSLDDVIKQILSEIEIDAQGKGKGSIRATARLAGVDDESVRKALVYTADQKPTKLAQMLMGYGFSPADLNDWRQSKIPDLAISVIFTYYAYDAGRYCTEQARLVCQAFMTIGIRSWMQKIKGWEQETAPKQILPTPSLEEISTLLDLTLGKAGLEPKLVAGAKLNAIAKRYPHLKQEAEEAKSMLAVSVENKLLAPRQLGEILTEQTGDIWSPQRVNKFLIEEGFQVRNPEGNPDYLPTEKGKPYSQMTLNTAKGRDKTVQHLRWLESVLETLDL